MQNYENVAYIRFFSNFVKKIKQIAVRKFKIVLALAAALLGGTVASAQAEWNANFGYATTSFRGADCSSFLSSHPLRGFYAGVTHEFYFSALAGLTFEPGVYYYYQSAQNDANMTPKFIREHYLSVPLNVKYSFELSPSLMASFFSGPVVNAGLFGNLYQGDTFVTNTNPVDAMHGLIRVNAQWDFGVGITLAGAVQVRVGYALGLSRLIREQNVYNNCFTAGIGFLF